ncbi:MAG: hypothetical protein HQL34_07835, partial [Alphaproteobacteria bacterium]|nr:hypothetical protein [Alphaproteobacteria bacterium]
MFSRSLPVGALLVGAVALAVLGFRGHAHAGVDAAFAAYLIGDYATARIEAEKAAGEGSPQASFLMGALYANGEGVPSD